MAAKKRILLALTEGYLSSPSLASLLAGDGYQVDEVGDCDGVRSALAKQRVDLALIAERLPDGDPFELGLELKTAYPYLPLILVTKRTLVEQLRTVSLTETGQTSYFLCRPRLGAPATATRCQRPTESPDQ